VVAARRLTRQRAACRRASPIFHIAGGSVVLARSDRVLELHDGRVVDETHPAAG
jgi:hypothetical protein